MEFICDSKHCTKEKYFILSDCNYIPTEISSLVQILGYFQYQAPNISSAHSWSLPENLHDEIYELIIEKTKFVKQSFASNQKVLQKRFLENHLSETKFCYHCKRFTCLKYSKESKLECLLRHLRNSIAHGLVYLPLLKSRYICFKDINKDNKVTAMIILEKNDLYTWKDIIEKFR